MFQGSNHQVGRQSFYRHSQYFYWPIRRGYLHEFHLVAACAGDLVRVLSLLELELNWSFNRVCFFVVTICDGIVNQFVCTVNCTALLYIVSNLELCFPLLVFCVLYSQWACFQATNKLAVSLCPLVLPLAATACGMEELLICRLGICLH